MRICPTEAIRVWHGCGELLPGLCIDCGLCLSACPTNAVMPQAESFTAFHRYRHTVAIASPVLFGQFERDVAPEAVLAALQQIGFDEAVDMSAAIEAVLHELGALLHDHDRTEPLVSPFCPAVVRLIQMRYPALVELVAPLEPPQEVLAAAVREHRARVMGIRPEQVGVVFVTPCTAKTVPLKLHTQLQPSQLSGAVAISHVYGRLRTVLKDVEESARPSANGITGPGLNWALVGGQGAALEPDEALAVGGLENVVRTLDDIERGQIRDVTYVECWACRDGCVGGCLAVDNPYQARSKLTRLVRRRGNDFDFERAAVRTLAEHHMLRAKPIVPRSEQTLDTDLAASLGKMQRIEEIYAQLPQDDCGACGSPSCRAFAEDVVHERVEAGDCVFLLQERLRLALRELEEVVSRLPVGRQTAARNAS
jgi:Fe-S-cluster-containing hydrogenase component 2